MSKKIGFRVRYPSTIGQVTNHSSPRQVPVAYLVVVKHRRITNKIIYITELKSLILNLHSA